LLAWSHPNDPLLPDLQWACDAQSVGPELFGVGKAELTTLGYRPMRRAVLRAEGAGEARYLKVLPRGRAAALRRRHELLLDAGVPVPQPVASPGRDVVVTLPASGEPLAQRLMLNGAQELEPGALVDLLERFPQAACGLPARPPWSAGVREYAQAATAVLPTERARITALASRVEEVIRTAPAGPVVATHGDFYEGNLLVAGGTVTAVLDLDGVGPGHLVDDLACFLAHLAVLPCVDHRYSEVPAVLARFQQEFEERVDAEALRARAAGVALTLIAGARNSGQDQLDDGWRGGALGRLRVAERFLEPG
jgi:aminoglycoside phosphotransferase (APT) family kinase protein